MTTDKRNPKVSVLGLGLMGSALATNLLNAGHEVTVWNRTPDKAATLARKGARAAVTVEEALAASEVTLVCVTDHAATMELFDRVSAPVECTLVQLSTTTPEGSRELADCAQGLGVRYLDGSIFGLPSTVLDGAATVVFSGPPDLFETNRELFGALGTPLHLSTDIGAAVIFDRVWYAYVFAQLVAFIQGAAMAHKLGFSLDVYLELVRARTPVMVDQCLGRGQMIAARSYKTADASLDTWALGLEGTLTLCREHGIDDAIPSAVMDTLRRASAAGHGDSDVAAVFETLIEREAA